MSNCTEGPFLPPPSSSPQTYLLVDARAMNFNDLPANLTSIADSLAERPSIATLATILLSFTGFQDWLKLFLIGGVFETCRRVAFQAWHSLVDSIWITIDFEDGDDSYGEHLHFPPAPRSRYCRDTARVQALTMHHPHRLGDGMAFTTSHVGKGEETCSQHLVVWAGSPRG